MNRRWMLLALPLAMASGRLAGAAAGLELALVSPEPGDPVFGEVEVVAEVYPPDAAVERMEFYLDGQLVGTRREPPWSLLADAGEENREHRFEVVAHAPGGEVAVAHAVTARIRTDLELSLRLQQLYVTVERQGRRVLDLGPQDFSVRENGVPQRLVTFERGEIPFTAVVLVDASTSMRGAPLRSALTGARRFFDGMRPLDQAKLLLFSDRLLHETPFTSFPAVLSVGLAGVQAGGGTAANDHLYLALKRLQTEQGRAVVVLLSDGLDVESVLDIEAVRQVARRSQAVFYWMRLRPDLDQARHYSAWRGGAEHRRQLGRLVETVTESGGRILELAGAEAAEEAFQEVLRELRAQYVLGYYPSIPGQQGWRRVDVRVGRRGVDVRTRGGYVEPSQESVATPASESSPAGGRGLID